MLDKINALESEIKALEAKLEDKEQEKQALLPVPKKPILERIKGLFVKEKEKPAE